MLPAGDLVSEVLDVILYLFDVGTEERVLLQPYLIFDDDGRDTESLQRADHEYEMLGKAASIAVVDDGFGRCFENIADGVHARGYVYVLDVGLSLDGRIGEAAHPYPVKLPDPVIAFDASGLGDQPRQTAMRLDNANQRADLQHPL